MKKLAATLALSLVAFAAAGGSEPRSVVPLATGQVWRVEYQFRKWTPLIQELTLTTKFPADELASETYRVQGGSVALYREDGYISASQNGSTNLFCIAPLVDLQKGYALIGTTDRLKSLMRQTFTKNPTPAGLYATAQGAWDGTCTLKRLR